MKKRIWEIDFARGIAIILMSIFHLVFDLSDYYSYNLDYLNGFWYYEGKLSAIMFMLLSGISVTFGKSSLKRGGVVFGFGMLLTAVTYFVSPELYIIFGILSFMGTSMIIYHFIRGINTRLILPLAVIIIFLGRRFETITVNSPLLFPLGLRTQSFGSLDYYPLLPWFGVFLIGTFIGRVIYKEKHSLFNFKLPSNPISFMGRHSLTIYLIHQPIILAILFILNRTGLV